MAERAKEDTTYLACDAVHNAYNGILGDTDDKKGIEKSLNEAYNALSTLDKATAADRLLELFKAHFVTKPKDAVKVATALADLSETLKDSDPLKGPVNQVAEHARALAKKEVSMKGKNAWESALRKDTTGMERALREANALHPKTADQSLLKLFKTKFDSAPKETVNQLASAFNELSVTNDSDPLKKLVDQLAEAARISAAGKEDSTLSDVAGFTEFVDLKRTNGKVTNGLGALLIQANSSRATDPSDAAQRNFSAGASVIHEQIVRAPAFEVKHSGKITEARNNIAVRQALDKALDKVDALRIYANPDPVTAAGEIGNLGFKALSGLSLHLDAMAKDASGGKSDGYNISQLRELQTLLINAQQRFSVYGEALSIAEVPSEYEQTLKTLGLQYTKLANEMAKPDSPWQQMIRATGPVDDRRRRAAKFCQPLEGSTGAIGGAAGGRVIAAGAASFDRPRRPSSPCRACPEDLRRCGRPASPICTAGFS
jgi:hypothetical protein